MNLEVTEDLASTIIPSVSPRYVLSALLVIPILTVFGNALVVISVKCEKTLQTGTNYFVVSLAVADISLAVVVMPLAIWVEINNGAWFYPDYVCDVFVMFDVLFCTASIFNLVAICIDRFVAVTWPLRYSKHQNQRRVYLSIVFAWLLSLGIALPLLLGVNTRPDRSSGLCASFNADYILCSSLGSFYIPAVLMLALYYRVLALIRSRSRVSALKRARLCQSLQQTATHTVPSTSDVRSQGVEMLEGNTFSGLLTPGCALGPDFSRSTSSQSPMAEDCSMSGWKYGSRREPVETLQHLLSPSPSNPGHAMPTSSGHISGGSSPMRSPMRRASFIEYVGSLRKGSNRPDHVTIAQRRERKAIKTLVIVLGAFLFCWVPFFTLNIIQATCYKLQQLHSKSIETNVTVAIDAELSVPQHQQLVRTTMSNSQNHFHPLFYCHISNHIFTLCTWLGYVNSLLNPIIYTIFNIDFRKAFKKLLHL